MYLHKYTRAQSASEVLIFPWVNFSRKKLALIGRELNAMLSTEILIYSYNPAESITIFLVNASSCSFSYEEIELSPTPRRQIISISLDTCPWNGGGNCLLEIKARHKKTPPPPRASRNRYQRNRARLSSAIAAFAPRLYTRPFLTPLHRHDGDY